ncbi:tripartite tricarboxylate transporter substrate-binding protein [Comamonas aquatica]|uniref:tripartite tricarboxylate transporter substrate-binding protein n=1 Tax=Comamonas aquatica TaxID=225991 RepID=UPI001B37F3A2|nr:tripartite tricarboxylate transporter substrate-binding protein [Comamonas aquatica]QTX21417.1 tripartite tricarboxylate transporter substrate binding protein [Comamonas aquatica]
MTSQFPFKLGRRAALTALVGLAFSAQAQDIIRIVVPFGAGAVQDTVARTFSNELGQELGASVIVENKAGAGGTLGTSQVAQAKPDGKTLVLAAASHNLVAHLYSKLPYHPKEDFVGVSYLGRTGYVVGVSSASGITSVRDLIERAKKAPNTLNYASAGNGSASHLAAAALAAQAGVELQHIPMKSTGDATTELLAGRVELVTGATIGMLAYEKEPRIKLLAYSGKQRSRFLPHLPTVAEAGVPGYAFDSWLGLLAPKGTPDAVVQRINQAVQKVLAKPEVQQRLERVGVEAGTLPSAQFQKLLDADFVSAGQIVKAAGTKLD